VFGQTGEICMVVFDTNDAGLFSLPELKPVQNAGHLPLQMHDELWNTAAFSPDGRFLMMGTLANAIGKAEQCLLEFDAQEKDGVVPWGGPHGEARRIVTSGYYCHDVVFSPDGRYIALLQFIPYGSYNGPWISGRTVIFDLTCPDPEVPKATPSP
jgi:hypothetical protein